MSDWHLLQQYIETQSEAAFAKIVQRHMKTVYFTCRRELRNDQLAEDATQLVFMLLAKKAVHLKGSVSISGWLFNSALWISRDLSRREMRRNAFDQKAMAMMIDSQEQERAGMHAADEWINEGLRTLSAADREAILMRYFDDLSISEIASALETSEVNARKRLSRAVERLRIYGQAKGTCYQRISHRASA